MDNTPADNGEAQNPVENDVGIVQNNTADFSSRLESILFSDEQGQGNSESLANTEEVQTEDKVEEADASLDGGEAEAELDPTAEDGTDVNSNIEEAEQAEPEVKSDGFQKRIDKLTYLRKQAEEQVEKLTEEVNSYKAKVQEFETAASAPEPTPDNPFADLTDEQKIKAEYETARELRFKCEESPDGFQIGEKYFSPEEVRAMRVNAMKAMELHLPKQLQFVKHKQEYDKAAFEQYPWYNKPESAEYKLAQEVMKNFKNFKNYPDARLFVGDYVQGYMARSAKSIKKTQPAKAVPQMQVKPSSSPTVSGKVDASARNIESRYAKTQSRDDLKKAVSRFL
jgi:hypothetical protein